MCNVYRRFVPNFARVAAPLNTILRKLKYSKLPTASVEQREAFNLLKDVRENRQYFDFQNLTNNIPSKQMSVWTKSDAH